jgi:hypothetical protein
MGTGGFLCFLFHICLSSVFQDESVLNTTML